MKGLRQLAECWEAHHLARRILELALEVSGARKGRLWVVQPQGIVLWYEAGRGPAAGFKGRLLPPGHCMHQLLNSPSAVHPLAHGASALVLGLSTPRVVGIVELEGEISSTSELEALGPVAAAAMDQALARLGAIVAMLRMVQSHDPRETPAHGMRVGVIAAEIYSQWARAKGLEGPGVERNRQILQLAAALHDLGKVEIDPRLLRKPGPLSPEELNRIKFHTIAGARMLAPPATELQQLAMEIALAHHERFDGSGYPGRVEDLWQSPPPTQAGLEGRQIPLAGRIVAIADVYDALTSTRVYREPWAEEKVLEVIRSGAGKQFDPELVEAFFAAYPRITTALQLYPEDWSPPAIARPWQD